MSWLERAERTLDATAIALFVAMFGVIVMQIALRYVFNAPLVWTDEAAQYLFVWISFFGWTMAARKRAHIGISVVIDRLPAAAGRALHATWCVLQVVFTIVLIVVGLAVTRAQADVQMVSLPFAFWPVYLVVPIAGAFLTIYAVRDMICIITRRDIKATEAQL